jgi:hypothetical protein
VKQSTGLVTAEFDNVQLPDGYRVELIERR